MSEVEGAGHMQAAGNAEALEKACQFLNAELKRTGSKEATPPASDGRVDAESP
jgi:hypothetical protein